MKLSRELRVSVLGAASFMLLFFTATKSAEAALVYLDPAEDNIYRGDTITMAVRIDTDEGECINTADISIEYDTAIRAVDVSRGNSILNIWLEEPTIDEEADRITLAGGIPGGYCGRIPGDPSLTNILAEIVFRLPGFNVGGAQESAGIRIHGSSQVLLNDGLGTKAVLRTRDAMLYLKDTPGPETEDTWSERIADDDDPPADFSITLTKDDDAFSGAYFIVFNTLDKQSGIDHYEVMEEPFEEFYLFKWGRIDAPWVEATSPYVLKDQSLNSTIRVKAIDKASNETIATLVPEPALRSLSQNRLLSIIAVIGIGILLAGLITYALLRRKREVGQEFEKNDDDTHK